MVKPGLDRIRETIILYCSEIKWCEAVKNAKIHIIMTLKNLLEIFFQEKRDLQFQAGQKLQKLLSP